MSWKAAIQLVRDILYKNSNKLYHLGLTFSEWEADYEGDVELEEEATDLEIFTRSLRGKSTPDFIRIGWTDMTAMPRMRMIPFRKLITSLEEGKSVDIGITKACLGLLQQDSMSPGTSASGEYRLHPDFSSIKSGPIPGHFNIYGDFREKDGSMVSNLRIIKAQTLFCLYIKLWDFANDARSRSAPERSYQRRKKTVRYKGWPSWWVLRSSFCSSSAVNMVATSR